MYEIFPDFSDFFEGFDVYPVYRKEVRCKKCGMTYSRFQKTGRVGCSECYNTFSVPLEATLRQIHSNSEHKGKIPKSACEGLSKKRKIEELKAAISKAVSAEDYEKAAELHKELKAISE